MPRGGDNGGKQIKKAARSAAAAVFWLLVWQMASIAVGTDLILPSPMSVLAALRELCAEYEFWLTVLATLARITAGLICGLAVGTFLGVLTALSRIADALLSPILRVVRATPVASFIILALLWLGRSTVPGFIASLIVIPVVSGAISEAIRGTDKNLLEMAGAYRFGFAKTLKYVYLPSVAAPWRAACVTAVGLAWKSGVAAEVLCQPKLAVGSELYYSKIYIETPELFAWTAVVVILSFAVESVFRRIFR